MSSFLFIAGPIEQKVVPAIDSAALQVENGLWGVRFEENREAFEKELKPGGEIYLFAWEYGFCYKLRCKGRLKARSSKRQPELMETLDTETRHGFIQITITERALPELIENPDQVIEDLWKEDKALLKQIYQNGFVRLDGALKEKVERLYRDYTIQISPYNKPDLELPKEYRDDEVYSLFKKIYDLRTRNRSKSYAYLRDISLHKTITSTIKSVQKEQQKQHFEAHLSFLLGVCLYHGGKIEEAYKQFSDLFKKEPHERGPIWLRSALARAIANYENGDRNIWGSPSDLFSLYKEILMAAEIKIPTLVIGESGTGKQIIAEEIGRWRKAGREFETLDLGTLTEGVVESQLFGHEKGAFTGADKLYKGVFDRSNGGTVFLDEVANVPPAIQTKLLRVVEYGRFRRVGGTEETQFNGKIILGTNKDIEELIRQGKFLDDLYYRISGHVIVTKPLRDRRDDIGILLREYLPEDKAVLDDEAWDYLVREYPWEGNVRELVSFTERAITHEKRYLFLKDVKELLKPPAYGIPRKGPMLLPDDPSKLKTFGEAEALGNKIKEEFVRQFYFVKLKEHGDNHRETLKAIEGDKRSHNIKKTLHNIYKIPIN